MGKALIIMVLGTGLFVSLGYVSTQEALVRTNEQQVGHEEVVLAREIARSGFNVGMGMVRPYGANLIDAVLAVNGSGGDMRGEHQGGEYRVKARALEGFTIEITSTGYFGGRWVGDEYRDGAVSVMTDTYSIPVLMARKCSVLNARFLESQAGYCSAVFLERYEVGATGPSAPEMLFPAGHYGDNVSLTVEKYLAPGTQMNLFIGVDENCSTRPGGPLGPSWKVRQYDVLSHVFRASDYNHLHYALDLNVERLQDMSESLWGMVEENIDNNQRWRIGWEDQHITRWDRPHSTNPRESLQALKIYGYDGNGWIERNADKYRKLRDYGDRPDYSDQVIEVWLDPVDPSESGGVCQVFVSDGGGTDEPGGGTDEPGGGTDEPGTDEPGGGTDEPGTDEPGGGSPEACPCPRGNNNKKVYIRHYPPGNRNNPQDICIGQPAWTQQGHSTHAGDYVICTGN